MMGGGSHLTLEVNVRVEAREGHWAAILEQFPITVYGDSEQAAEQRALDALTLLLSRHAESAATLANYLTTRGVAHVSDTQLIGGGGLPVGS